MLLRQGKDAEAYEQALRGAALMMKVRPTQYSAVGGYFCICTTLLALWEHPARCVMAELDALCFAAVSSLKKFGVRFRGAEPRALAYRAAWLWLSARAERARVKVKAEAATRSASWDGQRPEEKEREAQQLWTQAIMQAESLEMPYERAIALSLQGRFSVDRSALEAALRLFREVGASFDATATDAELNKLE